MVILRAKNKNHPLFSIFGMLCIQELSPNRLGDGKKKNTLIMVSANV